jgi:hypothetical protein
MQDFDEILSPDESPEDEIMQRHRLPHNRTWRDYVHYPRLAFTKYSKRMTHVFGWRFLVFLAFSQLILKGLAHYMTWQLILPLFRTYLGVSPTRMQIYQLTIFLPWTIKALIALASDLLIVGGYHKRFWLYQSAAVGMVGSAFLFLAYLNKSAIGVALCLMAIHFEIATFDLLSEGVYSAMCRDKEGSGSDIQVLVQSYQSIGAIISACFVGTAADEGMYMLLFGLLCGIVSLPLIVVALGWLPEERDMYTLCGRSALQCSKSMIVLIACMGVTAPICTIIVNTADPIVGFVVSVFVCGASLLGAFYVFDARVAAICLYQVLINLSQPRMGAALDYFYTASSECVPNGPAFSYTFYQTYAGVAGTCAQLVGTGVYQAFFSEMRFRTVLIVTAVIGAIGNSPDLLIITRFNLRLGMSDQVSYMIGEAVMEPLMAALNYIPASTLLSKVVPKGMESSTYAFMAGMSNFASGISEISGGILMEMAGIKTNTTPCNFSNLWWLVLICHVLGPLVVGILAAGFLIPNSKQTEEL